MKAKLNANEMIKLTDCLEPDAVEQFKVESVRHGRIYEGGNQLFEGEFRCIVLTEKIHPYGKEYIQRYYVSDETAEYLIMDAHNDLTFVYIDKL